MTAHDWAERLASGEPIDAPVALVVAHPDDETLWAGAALDRLRHLTLILLTDGAPEDMGDAQRLGFTTREDYARARANELTRALEALDARPKLIRYEVPDKQVVEHLPELIERLRRDLTGAELVITHPHDGGHPDHDAAALAVSRAASAPIVEFACYAQVKGARVFGRFVADPDSPEWARPLDAPDRARVDSALAAHATQALVFGEWRPEAERWRAAPRYDFTQPAPGEGALYDGFGWTLTSHRWRTIATEALQSAWR